MLVMTREEEDCDCHDDDSYHDVESDDSYKMKMIVMKMVMTVVVSGVKGYSGAWKIKSIFLSWWNSAGVKMTVVSLLHTHFVWGCWCLFFLR